MQTGGGKNLIVICLLLSIFAIFYRQEQSKFIHFSIDDTILLFDDLNINKDSYHSIFDNSTLRYAKELHDLYGTKVTFYCFYEFSNISLKNITSQYRQEFEENSDWLKFGFHAYDAVREYNSSSSQYDIDKDYLTVMTELERIVGKQSITTKLRLEKFSLNEENAKKLRTYGVNVLFGSDSLEKSSYYLNSDSSKQLFMNGYYYDSENDISFLKTDIRLERMQDVKLTANDFKKDSYVVIFTHEWLLNEELEQRTKQLLEQFMYLGYQFSI